MNLLFLDDGSPSGTGTYAWSLLSELAAAEDLSLVVFLAGDATTETPPTPPGVEVVRHRPFRSVLHRIAYEQAVLPREARRHGLDVLLNPGYVSPGWGSVPSVTTVHDLYYARCPEALTRSRRLYYRAGTALAARRSRALVAVSANTEADLLELVPAARGKTRVIHEAVRPGLLTADQPPPPPIDTPYFLVVAAVTGNKNVDVVLEAAKRFDDPVTVQVVGSDPYGLLAAAIERHGAQDRVVPVGTVDDDELRAWYAGAVAVIHPSRYEGFGLPALEAQALGAPLICSRAGALPEVVGEGARFFDADDVSSLVDAMEAVLADEGLRRELIDAGRRNVDRFSWARAGEETADLLREVARG